MGSGASDFECGGKFAEFLPGVFVVLDGRLDVRDAEGSKADVAGEGADFDEFGVGGVE